MVTGSETAVPCRLVVEPGRLSLAAKLAGGASRIEVDFIGGRTGYRRHSVPGKRQPLGRAVGRRHGIVSVVDATAGLGADTFLLACMGCPVTAVERSPVLHALLEDGLMRARARRLPDLQGVLDRITLVQADARAYLAAVAPSARPDVVFLDPMYPVGETSALPQKQMRVCRAVVGDDPDAGELLAAAKETARRRVVVKRHPHAPPLAPGPSIVVTARRVRYDVYVCRPQDARHFAAE